MSFLAHILAEKAERGLTAPCVYTTGFAGQDFALLPALLEYLDAVAIDIRFAPADCESIQWRKDYLRLLLRDRYRHVPHLGNRFSRETGKFSIQNLRLGVRIITEMRTNLLLLCECASRAECHRTIIAENLQKQGFPTQEIADWKSLK